MTRGKRQGRTLEDEREVRRGQDRVGRQKKYVWDEKGGEDMWLADMSGNETEPDRTGATADFGAQVGPHEFVSPVGK